MDTRIASRLVTIEDIRNKVREKLYAQARADFSIYEAPDFEDVDVVAIEALSDTELIALSRRTSYVSGLSTRSLFL